MELENTQILDNEITTENNEESTQVGVLIVGSTSHPVIKGSTKIGRNPALCKIILNDTTVSKVHAEIQAGCEAAFLSDVRSVNGTKIKDVPLKPFFYYSINNGDEIYLGAVKATFKTSRSSEHNASIVPETPASSRRHAVQNTPGTGNASDCLFNNTSVYQSDDSVVTGTQRKETKTATFQQPLVPANRRRAGSGSGGIGAILPTASEEFRRNKKATILQEADVDGADLHELETQQLDDRPIVRQSRVAKKLQLGRFEENIVDADIYDAETQILPLVAESEGAASAERGKEIGRIETSGSSSRRNNSSSNFSRELQISTNSSPPESPNSTCENADIEESKNLLEYCETPLLRYEKTIGGLSVIDNAGEINERDEAVKEDAIDPEEAANANASPIAVGDSAGRGKPFPPNHVVAESDDDSVTDDEVDIRIAGAKARIDDNSITDDEGKFESFASNSRSKKEEETSSSRIRRETAANIFEAETQRIEEQEPPKVADAKNLRETAKDRDTATNIFDAETQRLSEEAPYTTDAKNRRKTAKDRDTATNIFDVDTQRLSEEDPYTADAKSHRKTAKDRDTAANIFDVETQRLSEEAPYTVDAQNLRRTAKDRDTATNVFDAETQRLSEEAPYTGDTKNRRESAKDRDAEVNIFEAATQRLDEEAPNVVDAIKHRNMAEDHRNTEANIFEAATQRVDHEPLDSDLDLLPTQVLGVPTTTSTPLSRCSRTFKSAKTNESPRSETVHDLHLAPTQITTDGDDAVGGNEDKGSDGDNPRFEAKNKRKKRDNCAVDEAATPVPVTPSRQRCARISEKGTRLRVKPGVDLTETRVTTDRDDTIDGNTRKSSANASSSAAQPKNTDGKKSKRSANLDDSLTRNLGKLLDEEAADRETGDESTQLLTQNLVDILMPTQRLDADEMVDDIREPESSKRKKMSSPTTLGFVDGQAITGGSWIQTAGPTATSTTRDDGNEDEENTEVSIGKPPLSECNDEDDILFGLPEVKISGTLSNPGSPCPSTTSSHSDLVSPTWKGIGKSIKVEGTVAVSSTECSDSPTIIEPTKSLELYSPVVEKKSRVARRKVPRKLIEDEDRDSDEAFGYNDLKKIADSLLASGSVDSTRTRKRDNGDTVGAQEALATTGRRQRRVGTINPPMKRADSSRRARKLSQPPSSLLVSDSNISTLSSTSCVKVQLTRLDAIKVDQKGNDSDNPVIPKANRKRRATMSLKDLTAAPASPARTNSRRTIAEGIDARLLSKEEHNILITGLTADYSKIVKKLGGKVVSEPSKATVLITDKVRRTYKFLCAVARGLRVVSINWLLQSSKSGRFLECDEFILKDSAAEKQYRFKLEKSLQTARTKKFLEGYTIIVTPKVNQPEIHELKGMVEACGGKVLARAPGARAWNPKTVIVSREEDLAAVNLLLSKCPKTLKISVQSTEFILTGILRQEVNFLEHRLDIT